MKLSSLRLLFRSSRTGCTCVLACIYMLYVRMCMLIACLCCVVYRNVGIATYVLNGCTRDSTSDLLDMDTQQRPTGPDGDAAAMNDEPIAKLSLPAAAHVCNDVDVCALSSDHAWACAACNNSTNHQCCIYVWNVDNVIVSCCCCCCCCSILSFFCYVCIIKNNDTLFVFYRKRTVVRARVYQLHVRTT